MLREYERDHANRTRVLSAIESVLARARIAGSDGRKPRFQRSSVRRTRSYPDGVIAP